MELRHLRYFIAAAEEEHFGRAAGRLGVTRPAVSQMVADLEGELGTTLFERLSQRVRLTAAGQVLLPRAQSLMNDLSQGMAMARRVGEGKTGALNIGYGSLTLLHPLFRAAVKRMHEECPDVALSLHEIATAEQPKALAEGRIQVGFMHFGPPSAPARSRPGLSGPQERVALDWLQIQKGRLGVVVALDHPLAARKSLTLADLGDERFVVVPGSGVSPGYGPLFGLCQQAGFEPRIVQEVASIASLLNLVSVGMGVGLTVASKDFIYPDNLAVIPLKGVKYATTFALGWLKGLPEPALARWIEIVRELSA